MGARPEAGRAELAVLADDEAAALSLPDDDERLRREVPPHHGD